MINLFVIFKKENVPKQQPEIVYLLIAGVITKTRDDHRKLCLTLQQQGTNFVTQKKLWLDSITVREQNDKKFFSETIYINECNSRVILGVAEREIEKREFHNLLDPKRKDCLLRLYKEESIPSTFLFYKPI